MKTKEWAITELPDITPEERCLLERLLIAERKNLMNSKDQNNPRDKKERRDKKPLYIRRIEVIDNLLDKLK